MESSSENSREQLGRDTIRKDHPKVQEWIATIRHAILDCNITMLDTAPWYGHGTSEIVIGFAMQDILLQDEDTDNTSKSTDTDMHITTCDEKKKLHRNELTINTKVGRYEEDAINQFDFSYDKTIESTQTSIRRMNCRYIDVLQLHDPEFAPDIQLLLDYTIPAMLKCRDDLHLVRAIGITGYPLEVQHQIMLRSAAQIKNRTAMPSDGGIVFDQSLTYCHYNLHDDTLFTKHLPTSYGIEIHVDGGNGHGDISTFAQFCHRHGVRLLAAAPLSMGLLTHSNPPSWHPASPELKVACRNAASLCEDRGVNLSTLATIYALAATYRTDCKATSQLKGALGVECTIIGMGCVEDVDRAVSATKRFWNIDSVVGDDDEKYDSHYEKNDNAKFNTRGVLEKVLTPNELSVFDLLQDRKLSPFAQIWKDKKYEWDGVREAEKFWEQIPGGKVEASVRMRQECEVNSMG